MRGQVSSVISPVTGDLDTRQSTAPATGWFARVLDRAFVWLAVTPTALTMLLVFGLPLAFSLYLSMEGWSADETLFGGKFAGTANYEALLTDPDFIGSLTLTLGYTAVTVLSELAAGTWASHCCSTSICRSSPSSAPH